MPTTPKLNSENKTTGQTQPLVTFINDTLEFLCTSILVIFITFAILVGIDHPEHRIPLLILVLFFTTYYILLKLHYKNK